MALASSSPMQLIHAVVEKLNIVSQLSIIQSAENEALGKPHPSVFLSTAHALGVPPVNCLVFEDSVNGVIAALAARMKVVAIPDTEQSNDPRFVVAHLRLPSLEAFSKTHLNAFTKATL